MRGGKEIDRKQVRAQAKKIIDSFMSALEKVETEEILRYGVKREDFLRKPGESKYNETDFSERMLDNAKNKEDDQIVAEKKKW
ncbi:hypothetical protein KY336_03135 [Candidatus Woesearchaeota archaeon]|nr:hypothetical protein [Candidatus Woesearchaeota archaeon]